ncbi:zinc finger protein 525-like isoform X1 [Cryptotermes secundus]|uniref:zinc finger protein 525-like isoform X1 n=1 Tax=Cryptotermes secundus TaxID=105785 RepID=UPI000CD7B00E|nr:zinc finger protein 525-like isoform X1 [Cryptotermes secundus]
MMTHCGSRLKIVKNVKVVENTVQREVILKEKEVLKVEPDECVSSIHNRHTSENAVRECEEDFEFVMVKNELQDDSFCEEGFGLPERQISRSCEELNDLHEKSATGAGCSGFSSERHTKNVDNTQFAPGSKQTFHMCGECGRIFKKPSKLKSHVLVHTGEKPFKCEVCNRGFKSIYHLKTHCKIHTGEKPYVCNICGKEFSQPRHLKTHMLIHTCEKPYSCKVCNKEFAQLGNLNKHVFIHTGEKPHVCTVCRKEFSRLDNLRTHSLIHTGEKPHVCEVCGKMFQHGSNFLRHKQIHRRD